jgi:hypothetical protein
VTADERDAIEAVLVRYLDAIDRFDFDAVGACFAVGARASYGGEPPVYGRQAIVDLLRSRHTADASTHLLGGVLLEPAGDGVGARSTVVAYLVRGGAVRVRGLRYEDRLVRVAGGWAIAERVHSLSWMGEVPVVA